MRLANNLMLLIIVGLILLLWKYDYSFTYRKEWTETIFKISLLFCAILLLFNNIKDR